MNENTTPQPEGTATDGGIEVVDDGEDVDPNDRWETEAENEVSSTVIPDGKPEFLLELIRRRPILRSLQSGPASTSDLLESVDMSRSTVHRAIKSLMEYDVVAEADGEYHLTSMGQVLATQTDRFGTRVTTTKSLNQFLNSINGHAESIPVEHFVDATVVRREPRHPHVTIHRIIELLKQSDDLRMFSTVISPVYVDVGYREMTDGMEIEAIFDQEVIDIMLSEYPEKAEETIGTGNFHVYAHDGLPFELFIFDDKIGMAAHNENGNAEILVECDDPAAIEWAESLYAQHLGAAQRLQL